MLIFVRKEEYGGCCAICGCKVLLNRVKDGWFLECLCGTVNVPAWATIDGYAQKQYLKRFQIEESEVSL